MQTRVTIRPHAKSHKCPELAKLQIVRRLESATAVLFVQTSIAAE